MPPPKKEVCLAQAQRQGGSNVFTSGLMNNIESLRADPSYVPDDEDSDSDGEMSLSDFSFVQDGDEHTTAYSDSEDEPLQVSESLQMALSRPRRTSFRRSLTHAMSRQFAHSFASHGDTWMHTGIVLVYFRYIHAHWLSFIP